MIKQKMVIKIFGNDNKIRTKALKTAVRISGVESVSLKDSEIEVIGVGVDAAELTNLLRDSFGTTTCCMIKRKGYAELLSVKPVKKVESSTVQSMGCQCGCGNPHPCRPMYFCAQELPYLVNDPSFCSIL